MLPASSQFEKAEATFFNLEFPRNGFHLRQPLFEPRAGTLTEAEIHARLVEALGELDDRHYRLLRRAARLGMTAFALAFAWKAKRDKRVARYAPVVLYRTLGNDCPREWHAAASLWGVCQMYVRQNPGAGAPRRLRRVAAACRQQTVRSHLAARSGVVFAVSEYADSWQAVRHPGQRINLHLPELMPELAKLEPGGPPRDTSYPFMLSAGERRSDTSNTAIRDPGWHRKGPSGRFASIHRTRPAWVAPKATGSA